MRTLDFWKAVIVDKENFLESLVSLLAEHRIRYCVLGGQGVNPCVTCVSECPLKSFPA